MGLFLYFYEWGWGDYTTFYSLLLHHEEKKLFDEMTQNHRR